MHVPDPDVGAGAAVPRDGHEPRGRVDAGTGRPPQPRELDRQPGAAGDIEQPVPLVHPQPVVDGDVLAAVRGLEQGGEVDRLPAPTLARACRAVADDAGPGSVLQICSSNTTAARDDHHEDQVRQQVDLAGNHRRSR